MCSCGQSITDQLQFAVDTGTVMYVGQSFVQAVAESKSLHDIGMQIGYGIACGYLKRMKEEATPDFMNDCGVCGHLAHEDGACLGMVGADPCDCEHKIEAR